MNQIHGHEIQILKVCFVEGITLARVTDPDKYKWSDYGIGLDTRIEYSLPDGSVDKNVIIFGVDMISTVHIDNKGKDIVILDKISTQGLNVSSRNSIFNYFYKSRYKTLFKIAL